jgi:AAA+ ATPase superfamily predicted ATPase
MDWGFYGRQAELHQVSEILARKRWFFAQITGRRRIGKTRLIQRALETMGSVEAFYVQIPDSDPAGVVSAVVDQMEVFGLGTDRFRPPRNLSDVARLVSEMVQEGFVVTLDEFQYFNRPKLREFCSHLQRRVDALASKRGVRGGLLVLGSIQTDMTAILEDRGAPLYNRTTDEIQVPHWDIASLLDLLNAFDAYEPLRLLFLWNLFEGVPKFYRDCFEQGVLKASRTDLLRRVFFESSSPLKNEADNWFLKELHGRYDTVLRFIARHPGCSNSDLEAHIRQVSGDAQEQVGGHLKILSQKYRLIEKRLPIFADRKERKGRYYITDNFLRSWLGALAAPSSAISFSPVSGLVSQADDRLKKMEGFALEKLVASVQEERSRRALGDFQLSERISGYWDRSGAEIDIVGVDRANKKVRFTTCKRNESELNASLVGLRTSAAKFLQAQPAYADWKIEYGAVSPEIPPSLRRHLTNQGIVPDDFDSLFSDLT